ncbi:MAG: hypothetical protein V3U22_04130 [Vicinamibacteria bacterium]
MAREQEAWSLADDLEQVLQFRDAKDLPVFEAVVSRAGGVSAEPQ